MDLLLVNIVSDVNGQLHFRFYKSTDFSVNSQWIVDEDSQVTTKDAHAIRHT
jgi:hypothetical protein